MPTVAVYDIEGNRVGEIELSEAVFGVEVNENAIYEVVKMQLANRRSGTASTKERSYVKGGGKKPWRQKGTGRARAGSIRSPIWRGGGIVFGPRPRDYSYQVPKKVRRLALKSALTLKVKNDRVVVLRDFPLAEIKTKRVKEVLDRFALDKVLIVIDRPNPVLELSARNIKNVKTIRAEGLNVFDLLNFEHVIFLEPSIKTIEGAAS
ncbi:MAG TPA: 50S ribosomal protein L4 [Syntrophales bacterium]|nr:50S ribosomal protein L4 [Syntrophales bacterium]HOL58892.1 50S ribosomal protein L4 [Syntrophales bacterium]HPO35219.1 50S ribosomal protein L4 [Syntrophales bacterium]